MLTRYQFSHNGAFDYYVRTADYDALVAEMQLQAKSLEDCRDLREGLEARVAALEAALREEHGGKHYEPECPLCVVLEGSAPETPPHLRGEIIQAYADSNGVPPQSETNCEANSRQGETRASGPTSKETRDSASVGGSESPAPYPNANVIAWMRGVTTPGGPWGPAEHDAEFSHGDDRPDGDGWFPLVPLYHRTRDEKLARTPVEMTGWCTECGCGKSDPDGSVIFAHLEHCSKFDRASETACEHDYSGRCNNIDGSEQIFCAKCGRNP